MDAYERDRGHAGLVQGLGIPRRRSPRKHSYGEEDLPRKYGYRDIERLLSRQLGDDPSSKEAAEPTTEIAVNGSSWEARILTVRRYDRLPDGCLHFFHERVWSTLVYP